MINDIKLDGLGNAIGTQKPAQQQQAPVTDSDKTASITVSNNLSKIAGMIVADEEAPQNDAQVSAMRLRVQNGDYKVDTDALSEKLTTTLFSKTNGI